MQYPQLYLGLMGFDAQSEAALRRCLALRDSPAIRGLSRKTESQVNWQIVDFKEADALLICGAGVKSGFGTHLQFQYDLKEALAQAPLGVDLSSIKLPFALSHQAHLTQLGIDAEKHPSFDLDSEQSILRTLDHLETVLRPLLTLYSLAVELTERRQELDINHTYHLERNGALDVILDVPLRRALLRPTAKPEDMAVDGWSSRPKSANFAPANFMECSLDELGWVLAMHSPQVNLPKRYHSKPIYMRHNPRVRSTMLYPRHSHLVGLLWDSPHTLGRLSRELPDQAHWLERDLYAMYLTHCISTQPSAETPLGQSSLMGGYDQTSPFVSKQSSDRMKTMPASLQALF